MEILDTLDFFLEHSLRIKNNKPYSLFINGPEYFITYNTISKNCIGLKYVTKDKFNIQKIQKLDNYIFERAYKNGFIYRKDKSTLSRAGLLNNLFNNNKPNNIFEQSDVSKTVYNPYYKKGILISLFSILSPNNNNPNNQCKFTNETSYNWDISLVDTNNSGTYKAPIGCPPYIYRGEGVKIRKEHNLPSIGQHGRVISFSYLDAKLVGRQSIYNKYVGNFGNFFIIYDNYFDAKQLDNNILGSFTRDAWTDHRDIKLVNHKIIPGAGLYNLSMVSYYANHIEAGQWCGWLQDNSNNLEYTPKQRAQIQDIFENLGDDCSPEVINEFACECCQLPASKCDPSFYSDLSAGLNAIYNINNKYPCWKEKHNDCFNEILIRSWTYNEHGLPYLATDMSSANKSVKNTNLVTNLGWKNSSSQTSTKLPLLAFGTHDRIDYDKTNYDMQFNVAQLHKLTKNTSIPIVYLNTMKNIFTDISKNNIAKFTNTYTSISGFFTPDNGSGNSWDGTGCCAQECIFGDNSKDFNCKGLYNKTHAECKQLCTNNINCGAYRYGYDPPEEDTKICHLYTRIKIYGDEPREDYGTTYIKDICGAPFLNSIPESS